MISGLKIRISGTELHEHLLKRAEYHKDRAEHYKKQADSLKEQGGVKPVDPIRSLREFRQDPLSSLQDSAKEHTEKYGYFKFLADHLVTDEAYELNEHDLVKIEIVSRYL
ncbi:MAG: hypothetical protein ACE5MK_13800 [Acidobacteriota bacterium]